MRPWARALVCLALSCASTACTPPVDLAATLRVQDVSSGWFDAGRVNGQNKLVPSITFRLHNTSARALVALQVNALFRRVTEKDEWGSQYLMVAGSGGLGPNAVTQPLTIRSPRG